MYYNITLDMLRAEIKDLMAESIADNVDLIGAKAANIAANALITKAGVVRESDKAHPFCLTGIPFKCLWHDKADGKICTAII